MQGVLVRNGSSLVLICLFADHNWQVLMGPSRSCPQESFRGTVWGTGDGTLVGHCSLCAPVIWAPRSHFQSESTAESFFAARCHSGDSSGLVSPLCG